MFVCTAPQRRIPFIDLKMFKDRNFAMGLLFIFLIGITTFSGLALLPPLLQSLMGYSVIDTGILMAPRGVGTMVSMMFVGRLVGRVDARVLVLSGLAVSAYSLWMMTGFDLSMDQGPIMVSGFLQGVGLGLVFVPLNTLAFATIAPRLRVDATAFFSLVRNVGQGVGISLVTAVLTQMIAVNTSELAERVTLNSSAIRDLPGVLAGAADAFAQLSGLVQQQAAMLAYLDDFALMALVTVASVPIVFFLRRPKGPATKPDPAHAVSE
jgi:DHA2 family multidrug resistance protein